MINICACGCRVYPEDLVKIYYKNESGHWSNRKACPDHEWGFITHKETTCIEEKCGVLIVFKKGAIPKRCKKCATEFNKLYINKASKKRYRDIKSGKLRVKEKDNLYSQDTTRWDCEIRSECLMDFLNYLCTPCKDCRKYVQPKS